MAAAGAATGNTIQALAANGARWIIQRVPLAMTALRVLGGAYLLWLGASSLRKAFTRHGLGIEARETSGGTSYAQGLTVNLLNPAITTFYVAVVPSFMPENAPGGYYGMLAAAHVLLAFASHTMWLLAFDRLRKLMETPAMTRAFDLVTAGVLIALAVKVLAN